MSLDCQAANCRGKIKSGMPGGRFWEGDPYACPRCGARYVVGITDDYEDDAFAYLIEVAAGSPQSATRRAAKRARR